LSLEPSLHNVFETPGSLSKILFINFDLLIFVIFIKFGNVQAVPWVSALEVIIQAIYQLFLSLVRNIAVVEVFLETFVVHVVLVETAANVGFEHRLFLLGFTVAL
jgi:hypothetical protein